MHLAFLLFIFHPSHDQSNRSPSFYSTTFQNLPSISELLSSVPIPAPYKAVEVSSNLLVKVFFFSFFIAPLNVDCCLLMFCAKVGPHNFPHVFMFFRFLLTATRSTFAADQQQHSEMASHSHSFNFKKFLHFCSYEFSSFLFVCLRVQNFASIKKIGKASILYTYF